LMIAKRVCWKQLSAIQYLNACVGQLRLDLCCCLEMWSATSQLSMSKGKLVRRGIGMHVNVKKSRVADLKKHYLQEERQRCAKSWRNKVDCCYNNMNVLLKRRLREGLLAIRDLLREHEKRSVAPQVSTSRSMNGRCPPDRTAALSPLLTCLQASPISPRSVRNRRASLLTMRLVAKE
jgi:hypothetical protein